MMADSDGQGGCGANADTRRHIPVLLAEVLAAIEPADGATYIDATFGAGGYSTAILEAARCTVLAVDRDPSVSAIGADLESRFPKNFTLHCGLFSDLEQICATHLKAPPDAIVFDIGVSSMQLDEAERGFSFQGDGPLDMRMSMSGPSAADVLGGHSEEAIAEILYYFGDERRSRAIARAIVGQRQEQPIERTAQLAGLISRTIGPGRPGAKHPATRSFQALRIYVNGELDELVAGLAAAEQLLGPGGRLAVVTFHSLEDRIVKRFLRARSNKSGGTSRHLPPDMSRNRTPSFRIVNHRPINPEDKERIANPRARSARLRVGERTAAPAHPVDSDELGLPVLRKR